MKLHTPAFALLGICLFFGSPAVAGIADSPLPVLLAGETTLHLYSVSFGGPWGGYMAAFFSCTSTDTAPMQVGVEVFVDGQLGNDAVATSLSVVPGGTVTFGTGAASGLTFNSNLLADSAGNSARVLSTSKKLICTAFLADRISVPPMSMVQLTMVKRNTQKGD